MIESKGNSRLRNSYGDCSTSVFMTDIMITRSSLCSRKDLPNYPASKLGISRTKRLFSSLIDTGVTIQ